VHPSADNPRRSAFHVDGTHQRPLRQQLDVAHHVEGGAGLEVSRDLKNLRRMASMVGWSITARPALPRSRQPPRRPPTPPAPHRHRSPRCLYAAARTASTPRPALTPCRPHRPPTPPGRQPPPRPPLRRRCSSPQRLAAAGAGRKDRESEGWVWDFWGERVRG
jgi:hypothetical protein